MLEQKADDTMLKFMKDLKEVRRRWTAAPRDARPTPRPDRGRVPLFVMGTSFIVGFSPIALFGRASLPSSLLFTRRRFLPDPDDRDRDRCPDRRRKSPSASWAARTW